MLFGLPVVVVVLHRILIACIFSRDHTKKVDIDIVLPLNNRYAAAQQPARTILFILLPYIHAYFDDRAGFSKHSVQFASWHLQRSQSNAQ